MKRKIETEEKISTFWKLVFSNFIRGDAESFHKICVHSILILIVNGRKSVRTSFETVTAELILNVLFSCCVKKLLNWKKNKEEQQRSLLYKISYGNLTSSVGLIWLHYHVIRKSAHCSICEWIWPFSESESHFFGSHGRAACFNPENKRKNIKESVGIDIFRWFSAGSPIILITWFVTICNHFRIQGKRINLFAILNSADTHFSVISMTCIFGVA